MSKLIRQLLAEKDPVFALALAKLEKTTGMQGIDARLTAEIMSTVAHKLSSLSLDPQDTTGAELFAALSMKLRQDEQNLVSYLGHPASVDQGSQELAKFIRLIYGSKETWAVKTTKQRQILKDNPPKKVMKAFHYQSADSLAKRMDPGEVFMAARLLESKSWWQKTKKILSELSNKDFEKTSIRIISLNDSRWLSVFEANLGNDASATLHAKECAVIGFVPMKSELPYMTALISVLYAVNEIQLHGSFLKLHFVNPSIGTMLVHAIDEGSLVHASIGGLKIHWRDVQRYHGLKVVEAERTFAHLDIHDLGWLSVETKLSLAMPEFAFWVGLDVCGVSYGDGKIISCNILDVIDSVNRKKTHATMTTKSLKRSLRSELMARYLVEPSARAVVLKQFDISGVMDEDW